MPNEVAVEVTDRYKPGGGFDTAKKKADEVGKSVKNIGQIAAGIIAAQVFQDIGRVAVRAFTDTLKAASGLEQAVGGTKAVFGEASKSIDLFAKNSAQATGLSERDFREMTTLVGGQLKRMTGDLGFATESSVKLTEVAADLAATYGGTTKQAMDSFAAALRGEADPAERFNLNLKASAVNAKAVALGLAESTGKVDESARAQAVYALILEQSADAQGQFAREADTAAVAQQKANAALENAQDRACRDRGRSRALRARCARPRACARDRPRREGRAVAPEGRRARCFPRPTAPAPGAAPAGWSRCPPQSRRADWKNAAPGHRLAPRRDRDGKPRPGCGSAWTCRRRSRRQWRGSRRRRRRSRRRRAPPSRRTALRRLRRWQPDPSCTHPSRRHSGAPRKRRARNP